MNTPWTGQAQFLYHKTKGGKLELLHLIQKPDGSFMLTPFGTGATEPANVVDDHWHGKPRTFKSLQTAMRHAERKMPGGTWMSLGVFSRIRHVRLRQPARDWRWVITNVTPSEHFGTNSSPWSATAVVSEQLGPTLLDSHNHAVIGMFQNPIEAMQAADRYQPKEVPDCSCTIPTPTARPKTRRAKR